MADKDCEKYNANTVKWGAGIAVTLLLFMISSLWTASIAASERESAFRVLETRVNSLEKTVYSISTSVNSVAQSASDMRSSQAEFQARMNAQMEYIKSDLTELRDSAKGD